MRLGADVSDTAIWHALAEAGAVFGCVWSPSRPATASPDAANVLIHALGDVGVLVLLLVPTLEYWVSGHVLAGR